MPCNDFSPELYDLYALGVADRHDEENIATHLLEQCETCVAQVKQSVQRATLFHFLVPEVEPSRKLRTRIIESVAPAQKPDWTSLRSPAWGWLMAGFFLLVGASSSWILLHRASVSPQTAIVAKPPFSIPPPISVPSRPPQIIAPQLPPSEPTPILSTKVQAENNALQQDIAKDRIRIAELETALDGKDKQLLATQRELVAERASLAEARQTGSNVSEAAERQLAGYRTKVTELTRQIEFYRTTLQSQQSQLNRNVSLVSLLSSPGLRVVNLQATGHGGAAVGRALLANNSQIVLYASNLPPLSAGRTYQLWLMRDRGRAVVSGGLFQPGSDQRAVLTVPQPGDVASITALAVTEEPAGGQPLPTGQKVLFGTAKS